MQTNKNNQTTSTKCQYQADASNPKWWLNVKWKLVNLNQLTNKKIVPIRTWRPWKPVATKKVDPNELSLKAKGQLIYSIAWTKVKNAPKNIVIPSELIASFLLSDTIEWCAHVTVAPEPNKIAVFNKGTANGLTASIPIGGQEQPNSIEGEREEWKKAQKKLKKKQTSDKINIIIPNLRPFWTFSEWSPWKVASLVISLNHTNIDEKSINKPNINRNI